MIAVIGHGCSPDDKGWGEEIDAMPVVRLHDWSWQNADDFGSRCDYGVLPGPWKGRALKEATQAPDEAWLLYDLPGTVEWKDKPEEHLGKPVVSYFAHEITAPLRERGLVPSRGTCAVWMAYQATGIKDIVLVGFDSILSGLTKQYSRNWPNPVPRRDLGSPGTGRHNHALECDVLLKWAEDHGITLHVADEEWPI